MITRLMLDNLAVSRGGRVLFSDLSLDLNAGEAVALTGANGSGKSSLLRTIAGLLEPAGGLVGFEDAAGVTDSEEARAAGLHLLGHHDGLKAGLKAREELSFQAQWCGGDDRGVSEAIRLLELRPLLDLETRKLSAGQRRRVALARLFAAPRPLWLLDEPFAPLDAKWRARLGELMAAHLAGGGMVIAAVHDPLPIPARELSL